MTKPTKWHVRPAKTQISLGIRPVWSVFAVHSMGSWGPYASLCGQRRLGSDWADVQADLSLSWAHMPFCVFCHEAAHFTRHLNVHVLYCDRFLYFYRSCGIASSGDYHLDYDVIVTVATRGSAMIRQVGNYPNLPVINKTFQIKVIVLFIVWKKMGNQQGIYSN